MVAIVGRPAECELRHVTRSDYHSARLVGDVHEYLGSLPRLSVLIGHIVYILILTYIPEMNSDCLFYIHLIQCRPKSFGEFYGIIIRSVSCPKAWHRHRGYVLSVDSKTVKCSCSHKQCKRGIKSA